MTDVILFRPKFSIGMSNEMSFRPPLGLLFIAAPLIKNNYQVKIIDEETNTGWLEELDANLTESVICVGISSMTGKQILGGLKLAKIVKNRCKILIVWGGLHPSMLSEQTIKNNLVDIVVKGEGEEAFLKIVTALKNKESFEDITNVYWKKNGKIYSNPKDYFVDLNNLPSLPYNLIDYEKFIKVKKVVFPNCKRTFELHTDRGCPHRCGFCYNLNINKRRWRCFSAQRILYEIEYLKNKFSIDGINFVSDNFFVDKKRIEEICKGIITRGIKFSWHADCRIDYFIKYENSLIDLLKRSGCERLTFGIESGSQKILNLLEKDINLNDIFKVNKKIKNANLDVNYHFMVGFPDEDKNDVLQTYKTMIKLYKDNPRLKFFGPSVYTPYPGTPLYQKCLSKGFSPPEKLEDWSKFEWGGNYIILL